MMTDQRWLTLRRFALALFVSIGGWLSLVAGAQTKETLQQFEQEPHTGTAEQALVGIEVVNKDADGTTETLHGNGFVLRCDGFILAPRALLNGHMRSGHTAASHTITIFLHPGDPHEKRIPTTLPGAVPDMEYETFKLKNMHLPALRTLQTTAMKPGDPLQLVFSRWNAAKGHFDPIEHLDTTLAESPENTAKQPVGASFMSAPSAHIPSGAIVVGPDGMGVGLVPGSGEPLDPTLFLSFNLLHLATNCVVPVPTTDAQFAAANLDTGEMISIPGGPVPMNWAMSNVLQQDMKEATVACIAPFKIDKDEVTNALYLKFWKSLTEAQRKQMRSSYYPAGWDDTDPPFPEEMADTPVLGVTQAGAMAYAHWAGKRLLTPYEWCMAVFGPKGVADAPDWVKKYITERNEVVKQVRKAHLDYVKNNPVMDAADFLPRDTLPPGIRCNEAPDQVHNYDFLASWSAPWIVFSEDYTFFGKRDVHGFNVFPAIPNLSIMIDYVPYLWPVFTQGTFHADSPKAAAVSAAAWSKKTVQDLTDPLLDKWKDPGAVLPVGSREYDVSRSGVRDMVMNARELVMAAPYPFSDYGGKTCVMGIGWSEMKYSDPAAYGAIVDSKRLTQGHGAYYRALGAVAPSSLDYRQGAFLHGTGRDGIVIAHRGDLLNTGFATYGKIEWVYATTSYVFHMLPPLVVPISRIVGRSTDWPPTDLLLAAANLWEATAVLSELNGVYLFEDPTMTQRNKDQIFDRLDYKGLSTTLSITRIPGNEGSGKIDLQPIYPIGTPIGMPYGLKMWVEQPRRPHKEIARPTLPTQVDGPQRSIEGSLYYVPPIGFRCAR